MSEIKKEANVIENVEKIVSTLPKEQLKSLFYLFTAKPDSRTKVFNSAVFLERNDIVELNDCITRKLRTHNIDAQITSVNIGYSDSSISEFGTWTEFIDHHWQEPERIEEIAMKWDFMVNIQGYALPQRHTLLVRISSDMKPGKFLQMIAAGNSDDFEQMDILTAPAFCRVDFINSQISKELINEVSDWYRGRKEPALIPGFHYWLKKKRSNIALLIHHSLPMFFSFLWLAVYMWLDSNKFSGVITLQASAMWLFFGLYLLSPMNKFGHILASRIYSVLQELEGSKVVFQFTSGDKKRIAEIMNENKKKAKNFWKESLWSFILNLGAGLLATYLYLNS